MKRNLNIFVVLIFLCNVAFAQRTLQQVGLDITPMEKVRVGETGRESKSLLRSDVKSMGPFGGKILKSVIDSKDPNKMLAIGEYGMYRSFDAGISWSELVTPGSETMTITESNGIVYAFFKTKNFYRSTDFGNTWESLNFEFQTTYYPGVGEILVDPKDPNSFLVGFSSNAEDFILFKGQYNESSKECIWRHIKTPEVLVGKEIKAMCYDRSNPTHIYATFAKDHYASGIIVSRDNGETFVNTTNNMVTDYILSSISVNNSVVYVAGGYAFASGEVGVYRSNDGGGSWSDVSAKFPKKICNSVAIDPVDPKVILAGSDGWGLYKSIDAGETWSYDVPGTRNTSIVSINYSKSNPEVVILTDASKGVFKSIDGGKTFSSSNNGISRSFVSDIAVNPKNPKQLLAAAPGDYSGGNLYLSDDFGANWTTANLPALTLNWTDFDMEGNMFVWSQGPGWNGDDGLYKSIDNGEKWDNLGPNPTPVNLDDRIETLAFSKKDVNKIFMGGTPWGDQEARIYRTLDGGKSWVKVYSFKDENITRAILKLNIGGDKDQFIYAIYNESDADQNTSNGILFSKDGGETWVEKHTDFLKTHCFSEPPAIRVLDNGSTLYAAAGDYNTKRSILYRSVDFGDNWEKVCSADNNYEIIQDIAVKSGDEDIIYLLTKGDNCLKYSSDNGKTWSSTGGEIYGSSLSDIFQIDGRDMLIIGGSGGCYKFEVALKRPVNLAYTTDNDKVSLTWEAPSNASGITGYNVYRDNKKINTAPVIDKAYNDVNPSAGIYEYSVTACYGTTESNSSVKVRVIYKAPELILDPSPISVKMDPEQTITKTFDILNKGVSSLDYQISLIDTYFHCEKVRQVALTDDGVYSYNMDTEYPKSTSLAADDFAVNAGESVTLSAVQVFGKPKKATSVFRTVNIYFFKDNGGKPGEVKAEFFNVPAAYSNGVISASLPQKTEFTEGTYWFSIEIPNGTYTKQGGWKWTVVAEGKGANFMFKNPKGGLVPNAADWTSSEVAFPAFKGNGLAYILMSIDEKAGNWVSLNTEGGKLDADKTETIQIAFNSASRVNGFGESKIKMVSNDPINPDVTVNLQLDIIHTYLAPLNVKSAQTGKAIKLSWEDDSKCLYVATSYNVFRNDVQINKSAITEKTFTDIDLAVGEYNYTVQGVYEYGKSGVSAPAFVKIFEVEAPLRLTGTQGDNKQVSLSWSSPFSKEEWLHYDNETIQTAYGFGKNVMSTLTVFDAKSMQSYAGMTVAKMKFFVHEGANGKSTYKLQVFKAVNKTVSVVYEQPVEGDLKLNDWNEFAFKTPVVLETGADYLFGMEVVTAEGDFPVTIDDGTNLASGLGNVVMFEDKFYTLPDVGAEKDGNWKIRVYVAVSAGSRNCVEMKTRASAEVPAFISSSRVNIVPAMCNVQSKSRSLLSYNVYRNGIKINKEAVFETKFVDLDVLAVGDYSYYVTSLFDEGESVPSNTVKISVVTGIEGQDADIVRIYPVPTADFLNIEFAGNASVEIFNSMGVVIRSIDHVENGTRVDMKNFSSGYYFVKVLFENGKSEFRKVLLVK